MSKLLMILFLLCPIFSFAHEWPEHQRRIEELEKSISKFEQELSVLVDRKKKSRDSARNEENLQRIIEIHAELISLRRDMDHQRTHITAEHPKMAHVLDSYDSRSLKANQRKKRYRRSHLSSRLDQLLIKVQMKYSSFTRQEEQTTDMIAVEKVVEKKRKKKREREADVYLRRRSKIKLTK